MAQKTYLFKEQHIETIVRNVKKVGLFRVWCKISALTSSCSRIQERAVQASNQNNEDKTESLIARASDT